MQGGQAPTASRYGCTETDTNNSGGLIDSILITRNNFYPDPEYTIEAGTSGNVISLIGQTVYVKETEFLQQVTSLKAALDIGTHRRNASSFGRS